jgi:molybdopterin molybdotransferase
MITIDEAVQTILRHTARLAPVQLPVHQAVGHVLAEPVVSDVDSPPHDKSLVDGYALRAVDVTGAETTLEVLEEITAGADPVHAVRAGTASRIMTGAPLPDGADAVVMIEQTTFDQGNSRVCIQADPISPEQNIMRRAASIRRGTDVLDSGHSLRAVDVGLMCEVGCTNVAVYRSPRVAVLATGDELVAAAARPGSAQIRNSNGPMLLAMARALGCEAVDLGICRDEVEPLLESVQQGLRSDVLILSGGVSAGVLDLVPTVFAKAGIQQVFHKVHLKPGKPMWFGVRETDGRSTLVFGLPGNPVGSLVCFELFVRAAVRKMRGVEPPNEPLRAARLACEHRQTGDRPTYFPAVAEIQQDGQLLVTPVAWRGSADQSSVAAANCLAFFPPGDHTYRVGDPLVIRWLET